MLGKAELDLDLLATGDAPVQAPAIVEDPMHQRMVLGRNRPCELPPHKVVRDVAGQAQIREAVEQMQGEEQIGGHPIAVRLDMHRHPGCVRQTPPSLDEGNAVFQSIGTDVRLQVDVIRAEFAHQRQYRCQIGDGARVALRLPGHGVGAQKVGDLPRIGRIDEAHARAVETGVADRPSA